MCMDPINQKQKRVFFNVLAICGNVSRACKSSGISRKTAYRYKERDKVFAERWEDAINAGCDKLEQTAHDRAVNGYDEVKTIERFGVIVQKETTTKVSDTVLLRLLEAHRPDKFGRKVDVTVEWKEEVKRLGIDPDAVLQQMTRQAMKQLVANGEQEILEGEIIDGSESESTFDTDRSESGAN